MSEFPTRLVRSFPGGDRIHLGTCRHASKARVVPWAWAEGRDDDEWLKFKHFRPCRTCLPELAQRQDEAKAAAMSEGLKRGTPTAEVACWKCGARVVVDVQLLWGIHWDCMTATGCDSKRYNLIVSPAWPADDPSGPRYAARQSWSEASVADIRLPERLR